MMDFKHQKNNRNKQNYPTDYKLCKPTIGIGHFMQSDKFHSEIKTKKNIKQEKDKNYPVKEHLKIPEDEPIDVKTMIPKKEENNEELENEDLIMHLNGAVIAEKPNVLWSDIIGLEDIKEVIKESVILPMKFPRLFTGVRQIHKGILLYGPSGNGKSFLAKAIATEAKFCTFFLVSTSNFIAQWKKNEKLVENLFFKAKLHKPSIIFIDDIDLLCNKYDKFGSSHDLKTEFILQMQGIDIKNDKVLILATTKIPWVLDSILLKRFDKKLYISLPNEISRYNIIKLYIANTNHNLNNEDFKLLAKNTEGYSVANIILSVKDAIMRPIKKIQNAMHFCKVSELSCAKLSDSKKDLWTPCSPNFDYAIKMTWLEVPDDKLLEPPVTMSDLQFCLAKFKPIISMEEVRLFKNFIKTFGEEQE